MALARPDGCTLLRIIPDYVALARRSSAIARPGRSGPSKTRNRPGEAVDTDSHGQHRSNGSVAEYKGVVNFSASTQSRVRAFLACGAAGPGSKRARRRGKPGLCLLAAALALGASVDGELAAQTAPPAFVATELVGRPTATSITVNAIFDQTVEVASSMC